MSTTKGVASATPTLSKLVSGIRADLAAIERDFRSSLEHAISAGEKLIQAKEQVKHGEWLPWLKKNFDLSERTARDYMTLGANRQRAADFNSIREALAALSKRKQKVRKKRRVRDDGGTLKGKVGLSHDPKVIAWVRARYREDWTREEIVAASRNGTDGWPRPGENLTNGGVSECRAAIAALEAQERGQGGTKTKKKTTWGGKEKRKVYQEKRKKGATRLRDLRVDICDAVMKLEHMELPEDVGLSEEEQDDIAMLFDYLTILLYWTDRSLTATIACMGDLDYQRKLKKLRELAEHASTGKHERMLALRKIERLQSARQAKQVSQ